MASLAAFLRPPRWAPALLLAGLLAAALRGEATSPLYAPPDIALAALWVLAWAVRLLGDAPRMWGAHGALSLFFDGAGGASAVVVSVALAIWEFVRWRPPFTPLGVAALGGSLLAPLAVGSSAWLSWAGLWLFGNVFVDAYGPVLGAAALGGVAAFLTVARGPLVASAVSVFFVFSAAAYFAGLRLYPDSTPLTNILMPALAASSLYTAVAAALAGRGPRWRAAHFLAFLALGLPSASGPYLYNPGCVRIALAAPGSVVWTLEHPP